MISSPGQFEFRMIEEIGRGGLGVVYEIEVIKTIQAYPIGTRLALKKLNEQWDKGDTPLNQAACRRNVSVQPSELAPMTMLP